MDIYMNENLTNLIAYIVNKYGPISGKKAFQKIFYFLNDKGIDNVLSYKLYHYGPYSSDLDTLSDILASTGVLSVDKNNFGNGFKISPSILTDFHAKDYIKNNKNMLEDIEKIMEKLPLQSPYKLELYSTINYANKVVEEIYKSAEKEDVIEEVINIKNEKFSYSEISIGYDYLKENNLL